MKVVLLRVAILATIWLPKVTSQHHALFVRDDAIASGKRDTRQTSADQMVQNILQWLQGVYTQNSRKIRQGSLREYLPPTNTQKPRPFQPPNQGQDNDINFIGYPPSGISPQPPFTIPNNNYPYPHPGYIPVKPDPFKPQTFPTKLPTEFPEYTTLHPGTSTPHAGSSTGYPGFSTGYPGPSTGYPGPSTGFPGFSTKYPGSGTDYPGSFTEFPGGSTEHPGPSTGYPGISTEHPGSLTTDHPGFSTGYPGLSTEHQGSTTHHPFTGYPSTYPSTYPTQPTHPPTFPTQPPTHPTQAPTHPSQPPTYPTQPPTYPTQPPTHPTHPPTYPTQPTTYPTQSTTHPTQPPTHPTQPPTYPTQSPTYPTHPPTYPTQTPTQPTSHPTYPQTYPTAHTPTGPPIHPPTYPPQTQPPYNENTTPPPPYTSVPVQTEAPYVQTTQFPSHDVSSDYPQQPGDNEPSESDDEELKHPPHIHAIEVDCAKDMMTINIEFNREFNGIIYSKGYYNNPACRYVQENSGKSKYSFTVSLNSCGTEFINAFDTQGQSYLENVLVLQNEAGIQEVWDTIRSVRCLWEGNLNKALSVALSVGMLTQEIVTFSGDTAMAKLDIQLGRGPFAPPANGLVKIGDIMTLVVSVSGDPGFDMQVKDCRAKDSSGGNVVALTDENGCVLKPKLFGSFQKTRNTGNSGASIIGYAFFNAFKFPDVMDLMIECNVELCKTDCEVCTDSNQKLEPGRRKRDLYSYNNETLGEPVRMGKTLRVILPEDLSDGEAIINLRQREEFCLSSQNFVISSVLLISLLTTSTLFSAYLWLKNQRLILQKC